jgi:hypothetical protein
MRRTLVTAITLVSAAAMTSGAGLTLASASPAISRHETFRIISTSETASTQSVIATGSFTAGGSVVPGKTVDKVTLYRGTFEVNRHVTFRTPPAVPGSRCILRITEKGTYSLSHGTGRYAGIHGTGKYTSRITDVFARTASNCGKTVAFQQITYEGGTVNK